MRENGYELFIKVGLLQLFIYLSRCYGRLESPLLMVQDGEAERMRQVRALIERHFAEPIILQQLSRMCRMSQSTFTDNFKRHTGKTLLEFRSDIRINAACGCCGVRTTKSLPSPPRRSGSTI